MNRDGAAPAPETLPPLHPAPRLVLFGLRCRFTDVVINELTRTGQAPVAVFYPGPPGHAAPLRVQAPTSLLPMAGQIGQPETDDVATRFQIGNPGAPDTVDVVESLQPDIIAVACYPRRLPRRLYQIARLGAVNVHPSLLPRHRGPDPLFWTLRDGNGTAGVTVHMLADELDTGQIVAQQCVNYWPGTTEEELEHELATKGGRLLAGILHGLGTVDLVGKDQPIGEGSYESWPTEDDYIIDTNRSARSVFTFIRGISGRGVQTGIYDGDQVTWVRHAVDWSTERPPLTANVRAVKFSDGFLSIEVADAG